MHCKIRISWLWIPFLLWIPWNESWKTLAFLFLFLSVHELAHIAVAKWFHYPIQKMIIYPFGLCAVIDSIGYRQGLSDLMILMAGPFTHMLWPLLLHLCCQLGWISTVYEEYLCMLNASILLFNLLPIYPLDGGRIMELLVQKLLPFTRAKQATLMLSIIFVGIIAAAHVFRGLSGSVVCILLIIENLMSFSSIAYQRLQFYHYRYQHPVNYPIKMNSHKDLYRFSCNIMKVREQWIKEDRWLSIFFHKR